MGNDSISLSFNREMAREYGVTAALLYQEIYRKYYYWKSQEKLVNGLFWCDQAAIADWLLISTSTMTRTVKVLKDAGLIITEVHYRPGTSEVTTWWGLPPEESSNAHDEHLDRNTHDEQSYIKADTEADTQSEVPNWDNQGSPEPVVVFFRVNPTGRPNGWKSQRVYSIQEEVDKIEGVNGEETVDFKYWKSPKWVGDEDKVKYKRIKAKLIQPDVVEKDETEYKMINGRKCKKTVYKDSGGNEHETWVQVDNEGLCF